MGPTPPNTPLLSRFLLFFIGANVLAVLLFWALRVPFMNETNFTRPIPAPPADDDAEGDTAPERPTAVARVWDSLYHSVMTQTTVGASDVLPTSRTAQLITGIQAFSTFMTVLVLAFWIIAGNRFAVPRPGNLFDET